MKKHAHATLFAALMTIALPGVGVAQAPAADPVAREEVVEQNEEQLGGAVLDAGENLARGLENSLKQEAQRDISGLERKLLPRGATSAPPSTPQAVPDPLQGIKADIDTLEKEEKEIK